MGAKVEEKAESVGPTKHLAGPESHFILDLVEADQRSQKYQGRVVTRFPPEPNGYPHIGHAKSICLNFGLAARFGGVCHLRMDDTNPETEDMEYVHALQRDIRWLGFDWADKMFYASDYFEKMYAYAIQLIKDGKAYVCSLSEEEIREYRGTVKEPGRPSPYRERSVFENLDLLERMRKGEFRDGEHVLRAKIDMASPNMKMRDPLLYRIRHRPHYRTGEAWCIYPMYDFAHCLSDAIEGITHSICTLEFENNRDIYDWLLRQVLPPPYPQQIEFARLNINYTIMSKRKLLELVEGGYVSGWDDPRMPTIAGMRRRGYTPEAIRDFAERIGVAKANSIVDMGLLEHAVRHDLNYRAPRVMGILRPLKVVLENLPEGHLEEIEAASFPAEIGKEGSRCIPMTREIYIEGDDFQEEPSEGYHRLFPGGEVRLRHSYVIRCTSVLKDPKTGEVTELRCTCDLETKGKAPKGRKVKGVIHWVSADKALPAEIRVYDRLLRVEAPPSEGSFLEYLHPDSLHTFQGLVEPSVKNDPAGSHYQFERLGFFTSDRVDSRADRLVFNRTVSLRDTFGTKGAEDETSGHESSSSSSKASASSKASVSSAAVPAALESAVLSKTAAAPPKTLEEILARKGGALQEAFHRLQAAHGLSNEEADLLTQRADILAFFEAAVSTKAPAKEVAKWLLNEIPRDIKERPLGEMPFQGEDLGYLVSLIEDQTISGKIAKTVLEEMLSTGRDPREIVESKGLRQVSDQSALASVIDRVLAANPNEVSRYKAGQTKLLGFFVGQIMKETKGTGNPQAVNTILQAKLAAL